MLGTFVPRDGKVLILVNGAYGKRMARICQVIGRAAESLETPEDVRLMALDAIDASVSVNETAPFMVEAARFGIDQARNA